LRFQVPLPVAVAPLPPLKAEPPPEPTTALEQRLRNSAAPSIGVVPVLAPVPNPVVLAASGPVFSPTNALSLALTDVPPAPPLTFQMLLQFFTDPSFTNHQAAGVMPVSFNPGAPPPVWSSSATYVSGPKP
jgi:hypothetical protein